jgi:hypothetical protein
VKDWEGYQQATRCWVEKVVVGLNFCPFAKREVDQDKVRYAVNESKDWASVLSGLNDEFAELDQNPQVETTLYILPYGFESFFDYLDLVDLAERLVIEQGYEGVYQVASFHPDYCFSGSDEQDPANYTNRSPYPMLHLIREASLEKALAKYPDPDAIPENNVALARSKGLTAMQALRQACMRA